MPVVEKIVTATSRTCDTLRNLRAVEQVTGHSRCLFRAAWLRAWKMPLRGPLVGSCPTVLCSRVVQPSNATQLGSSRSRRDDRLTLSRCVLSHRVTDLTASHPLSTAESDCQ